MSLIVFASSLFLGVIAKVKLSVLIALPLNTISVIGLVATLFFNINSALILSNPGKFFATLNPKANWSASLITSAPLFLKFSAATKSPLSNPSYVAPSPNVIPTGTGKNISCTGD